ncbi:MAG: DNA primase [Patescibacteria group bacterium]|nr:DNA primase [Patescibacteria group bacterium]
MPNPSDEIKSKLDIVEVIREYVPLKAAGYNFRANCPFHREKTPSFMVSPEKQIWHCFGCGKGGDIFSFIMEIEGLSFIEALRLLAKKAGVTLKKSDPALTSKRNSLLDIMDLAVEFYHKVLTASPAAEAARAYLKKRGLSDETITGWRLGYSPNAWDTLLNFLRGRGFKENEIFLAGLIVKKEKAPGFYDRFRGRIMFPLCDIGGNAVGFSARVSPEREAEEKMGKYINTPATMIYDKSKILFGLDKAKMAIKAEDAAVLVEGQMDCITAQQNNFKNVVASSGTALTAEQVSLIKRYTNNLFLSFDMDQAGDLASERGIATAMAAEMQIKVIEIIGAKDPDECIRENPDAWRQAVKEAKPMMQYYFNKTFAKFNKNELAGQRQSVNIILPIIAKFGAKIEQDFWLRKLSQEIDAKEDSLREKLSEIMAAQERALDKKFNRPGRPIAESTGRAEAVADDAKQSREIKLSETLLALAIKYWPQLEYIINHLAPDDLAGDSNKSFYKNLIIYYNKLIDFWTHEGGSFDLAINYHDFKDWLNNPGNLSLNSDVDEMDYQSDCLKCLVLLDKLVLLADKDFYDYTVEQAKAEVISLVAALRINSLNKRRRQIIKLIASAEKAKTEESAGELKELMEEFKTITEEIKLIEIK